MLSLILRHRVAFKRLKTDYVLAKAVEGKLTMVEFETKSNEFRQELPFTARVTVKGKPGMCTITSLVPIVGRDVLGKVTFSNPAEHGKQNMKYRGKRKANRIPDIHRCKYGLIIKPQSKSNKESQKVSNDNPTRFSMNAFTVDILTFVDKEKVRTEHLHKVIEHTRFLFDMCAERENRGTKRTSAFNIRPVYSIPQKGERLYNCKDPLEGNEALECLQRNDLGVFTKPTNEDTVLVGANSRTDLVLAKRVQDQLVQVDFSRTDKEFTMTPRLTAEVSLDGRLGLAVIGEILLEVGNNYRGQIQGVWSNTSNNFLYGFIKDHQRKRAFYFPLKSVNVNLMELEKDEFGLAGRPLWHDKTLRFSFDVAARPSNRKKLFAQNIRLLNRKRGSKFVDRDMSDRPRSASKREKNGKEPVNRFERLSEPVKIDKSAKNTSKSQSSNPEVKNKRRKAQ